MSPPSAALHSLARQVGCAGGWHTHDGGRWGNDGWWTRRAVDRSPAGHLYVLSRCCPRWSKTNPPGKHRRSRPRRQPAWHSARWARWHIRRAATA